MPGGASTPAAGDRARQRRRTALTVAALFAALYVLADAGANQAPVLFVVPIALAAIEFGVAGGLVAGLVALALVFGWDLSTRDVTLDLVAYLSQAVAYLLLGVLLGRFVSAHRALEAKVARSERLSLDLMATVDFDGRLKWLNDSWKRALGWGIDELRARPLVTFVHPEDRRRSLDMFAGVVAGHNAIGFRNRCRARDGSYRWLEWNARADDERSIIHATARDITVLHDAEETIRHHGEELERLVQTRTSELELSRRETLQRLALAAEYRDDDTNRHTTRVGRTSMLVARELGLPDWLVQTIGDAAPLHDVGKLGIPDAIMLKPGKLTTAQYDTMKEHTFIGAAILAGSSSSVLQMAAAIALTHHERWNGTGYPDGLAGEQIPLAARIAAIADTFDAITHNRPYKDARPIDIALAEIRRGSGSLFDPAVVAAFLELDHGALVQAADERSAPSAWESAEGLRGAAQRERRARRSVLPRST